MKSLLDTRWFRKTWYKLSVNLALFPGRMGLGVMFRIDKTLRCPAISIDLLLVGFYTEWTN